VQDAIGFTQSKRAKDNRLRLIRTSAGHGVFSLERRVAGTLHPPSSFLLKMARVQLYTTRWCGYCVRAKALLQSKGIEFEEISLDGDPTFRRRLHELTGGWTVPQVVIDGQPIGGYTELWRLDREGKLDERLAA
jgi:glutaredoxin 3